MSDLVTALDGVSFKGTVRVADAGLVGMVTVRGDLSDPEIARVLEAEAGLKLPSNGAAETSDDGSGVLWMSPDELMVLCAYDAAEETASRIAKALEGRHHLALNVSDARAVIDLAGPDAALREVLAKLAPADLRASSLPVGRVRRTRMAQVAAAFWFPREGEARVICFRSVADYVFGLLKISAAPGSEVGYFREADGQD